MFRLLGGGVRHWLLNASALVLLGLVVLWLSVGESPPQLARDFEECAEQVEASPASYDERKNLMTSCNARFAGRRKAGGGYSYFDFMQNRNFDIAGPNPTPEEQKEIDEAYIVYLENERRSSIATAFTVRQQQQQMQQVSLKNEL